MLMGCYCFCCFWFGGVVMAKVMVWW